MKKGHEQAFAYFCMIIIITTKSQHIRKFWPNLLITYTGDNGNNAANATNNF